MVDEGVRADRQGGYFPCLRSGRTDADLGYITSNGS